MLGSLLIRADASPRMGTGHVMRCLSLAQGWRRAGGAALFALAESTPALQQRLQTDEFEILRVESVAGSAGDAQQSIQLARQHRAERFVADGYQFDFGYQRAIKEAGLRLLFFDDYGHAGDYCADWVLNQNLGADAAFYARREAHTRLLLGPRYALLRDEFLTWRNWHRTIPAVARHVLVTLGGADPDNVTGRILGALKLLADIEVVVLVGGSNPHLHALRSSVSDGSSRIRLVVNASNMPELMAWADVAIAAGGTTTWELAFMGLPSLTLVLADNQRVVAENLAVARITRPTTPERVKGDLAALLSDQEGRLFMSRGARQLVDGGGASRVVTRMRSACLTLRRVRPDDSRLIWEWANDPEARAVSFSREPIPWESHQKWFAARLASPQCLFYLAAEENGAPVGQIRFDLSESEALLSVSLARDARGRGHGPALIIRGSEHCFSDSSVPLIRAYVQPQNQASVRAFEKAGYSDAGTAEVQGHSARQFILNRAGFI